MTMIQTRRCFLAGVSGIGAAALLRTPALAAEGPLETTSVRLPKIESICVAPQDVVVDLLRTEGFSDIRHVPLQRGTNTPNAIARGALDFGMNYAPVQVAGIDRGVPMKVLAGVHVGCFELFVNDAIGGITDIGGKKVGIRALGSPEHLFVSVIAANVGIDPKAQIDWVTSGPVRPKQLFIDGKIDAFLGFPPEPQELRARNAGHVIVNTGSDLPWSQYYCCMLAGNREFTRRNPVATKRVLRALLKAADLCAAEPLRAVQRIFTRGFTTQYGYAEETLRTVAYDKWREYDPEDTMRFYALRLHEAGLIKLSPNKIIADGTDWRFFNELKRELKA